MYLLHYFTPEHNCNQKIVVKYVLELSQRSKEVVKRGKEYNNHNEDPD